VTAPHVVCVRLAAEVCHRREHPEVKGTQSGAGAHRRVSTATGTPSTRTGPDGGGVPMKTSSGPQPVANRSSRQSIRASASAGTRRSASALTSLVTASGVTATSRSRGHPRPAQPSGGAADNNHVGTGPAQLCGEQQGALCKVQHP